METGGHSIRRAKAIENDSLTVMSDINGMARNEDRKSAGKIEAGGVRSVVVDLGSRTEGISTQVYL